MQTKFLPRLTSLLILSALLMGTSMAALAARQGALPQATAVFTFTPTADAYVIQSNPTTNYGASLSLRADASPVTRAYLRFVVQGLNGSSIQSAKLRLYANSANSTGLSVRTLADNTWLETKIAYASAPASGSLINNSKAIAAGAWVEVDVSSYVKAQATYSLVLTTTSATNINISSREAAGKGPQLVVAAVTAGAATATTAFSATSQPTQTPTDFSVTTTAPSQTPTASLTQMPSATSAPTQTAPSQTPTASLTQMPTATSMPTQTATSQPDWQPSFPIRAAFYYPWFAEAWKQSGMYPYTNYTPVLGFYSSTDSTILKKHIAMMQYGNIQAGIASWWGQGSQTDAKIPGLLRAADGTNFRWSLYYENESQGDPSVSQIQSDLTYIRDRYGKDPNFLRVNGKFVIFAYADGNDACGMADRWKQANTVGAYVVLKVFVGYTGCASQPDSWHQYSPAVAADRQGTYSYAISPGFWLKGNSVRLARDITRWTQNVKDMVASGATWQLITTFSEWGEGTAVEPALEWTSASGNGLYLDALHYNGNMP